MLALWAGSIYRVKDVCGINDLSASSLTLIMITSQNNGSFCWGHPQADQIVVSGKGSSRHPILFFVTTTEPFCQLQRSKSLNYSYAKKLYFPWNSNPNFIEHRAVELYWLVVLHEEVGVKSQGRNSENYYKCTVNTAPLLTFSFQPLITSNQTIFDICTLLYHSIMTNNTALKTAPTTQTQSKARN